MRKVLILTTTFPRWKNDTEAHFVFNLAKELTRFFCVQVLAPYHPGSKTAEVWDGVSIKRFRYWPRESLCYGSGILPNFRNSFFAKLQVLPFLLCFWWNALKLSRTADVVNAWWSIPCGVIASLLKKPYVLSTAGTDVMSIKTGFFDLFQKRAFNKAQDVTALSLFLKREIRTRYFREARVVPIGIYADQFKPLKKAVHTTNYRNVLFVGRLNEQKGCDVLLKAASIVNKQKKYFCRPTIIGEGEKVVELERLREELGVGGWMIGPQPNTQLKKYYQEADVLVFPSRHYEGLGLVMVEAMACKTPVIASAVGGVPDVIKDYTTGILVNEDDPEDLAMEITNLFDDECLYKTLQENGLKHVQKHFVWKKIGEDFAKILDL